MPIAAIAGISAIGSIGSSLFGANAASNAADAQTAAANHAADLQQQEAQNALDFQKQEFTQNQANEQPWLNSGKTALDQLNAGTAPGGSLVTPYGQQFTAPTGLTEENDPGYQARLQLGTDALQKSAAARGSVLTGGTAKALDSYAQDYASNEYGNVYNRALNTYDTNFNAYNTGQANTFNRLASLSGLGQNTATTLGNQGQAAANNTSNIDLTTGAQQGANINNAGAATASGYIGQANAYSNGLSGIGNSLTNYAILNSLSGYKAANAGVNGANVGTSSVNNGEYVPQ